MDYYNFNPDFEDSLAFLSPAAQTNTRLSRRVSPDYIRAEDVQYMRNQLSFEQSFQRPLSNTLLILKKTNEREIVEQYCDENIRYRPYPYPKLSNPVKIPKHRPLIRVTVIPNNNTATQTKLRKRRSNKKIHTTASNHESFFKAKNVFLVVNSNNREKIYEIKPTGSEYSNGARYHEEIPVEQNFQQLLSSLNMDKKKKKDKKGKKEKDKKKDDDSKMDTGSASSLMNMMANAESPKNSMLRECICPSIDTVSPTKSRVRITGKIGLTEDDRYVLKCAATIDGKPVETNYFQEQNIGRSSPNPNEWEGQGQETTREIPRVCIPCPSIFGRRDNNTQRDILKLCQKDEMVQCNCDQDLKPVNTHHEDQYRQMPYPAFKNTCPAFRSVETQYSPQNVNAVCFSNIEKLKIFSSKDQVVQCNCPQDLIMNSNNIGIDVDYDKNANTPKSCNSPLVIISVYPKQDSNEKFYEEENVEEERESRPPPKEKAKGKKDKKDEKGGKEDKKKGKRSRSPSPAKGKEEKKADKPKGKGKGKDKVDNDKPIKGNKKGGKKEKPSKDDKKSIGSKSPERRPSGQQFGISVGRCAECCMGCVGSSKSRPDNPQGAAQFSTKRMMNWVSAKSDVSNVAINIDGENEFYDVLFRQGDITTDLQVRKTLKDAQAYRNYPDDGSLENFFLEPDEIGGQRKRSFSQTYIGDVNQPIIADNTENQEQTIPTIHVRDSIEICHRREEKNSSHSVTFTSSASSSSTTSHTKANIKHFQGDNCKLPNPVERDKEIRELLGIEKPRASPSKTYQEFAAKAEKDCKCSVHCFYRRHRKTNVNTVSNVQELRRLYLDDTGTQASNDDDVVYMDEEYNDDDEYNIESLVCKDTEVPITPHHENSPIAYGCELGNKCKNKRQPCEQLSVLKTSSSSESKRQSEFYTPGKSFVSQRRSTFLGPRSSVQASDGRRICTPIDPSREPCGVVVKCPYDNPYEEEEEDEDYQPKNREIERTSRFERPSRLSDGKRISEPKELGKEPCGVMVQCPYKKAVDDEILENGNTRKSSAFVEENTVLPIEDEPFESPPLYQQLTLNRNINIYLQIEQFTKQKPIILSRKQYEKVKRAIEYTGTKKTNCICKNQSSSRVSGEIRRKSSEKKETKPEVSNKNVQCECDQPVKEKKKSSFWGKRKSKEKEEEARKKSQEPATFGGKECCTSNVSFVSSNNEAFIRVPSEDSVIEENNRPTQTRISNPFTGCSKQCNEPVRRKSRRSRFVNPDYANPEVTGKYSVTCCSRINPALVEEDENIEYETRKSRGPLQEEDLDEYVNRNRKSRQSRKTKLDNDDILLYDDGQRKQSRQTRTSRKSKLYDTARKSRRDSRRNSNRVSGAGDETLEQEEFTNEPRRSSRRERESEVLRDQNSKSICCNPVVTQDDGGMSRTQTPQEKETADVPKGLHYCKRCGRLKQLHSCGNCGRLNGGCLHTCYCYEIQEKKPEPSIKDIFISKDHQYAASSTEVRYTSVIYANYKHVTFSSANVPNENVVPSAANLLIKNYNSNSLHTIFKGRRRSPTPNLGTSAYSLYSEYSDATSAKNQGPPRSSQERKPFLRRLMSCLVMRSKTSNIKIDASRPIPKMTANSSVDSYHINTSLGAVELSSSIYDTSASFYSNHSIQPISSKIIKRGFLSSVRGFLTNRRT